MTNKNELLPCPFCGNDVEFWVGGGGTAEFYGHDHQSMSIDCNKCGLSMALDTCMDKNGEISKGYEFGCSCCNDIPFILRKRWNTRADVAEDVLAVVDEPVGYASEAQLKRMTNGHTIELIMCANVAQLIGAVALYRRP